MQNAELNELATNPEGDEEKARNKFREWRWKDGLICPHCGCSKIYEISTRIQYRCASPDCRKQFSDTSDTPFHARKMTYLNMMRLMDALNSRASFNSIAKSLGVEWRTVKMMAHKLEGHKLFTRW